MRAHTVAWRGFWLPVVILLSLSQVGLDCESPPPFLAVVTPAHEAVVTTPTFPLEIVLHESGDPSTLRVELNGEDLTDQLSGGPTVWTATLGPGAPLRDHNELRVAARAQGTPNVERIRRYRFDYLPPKARARVIDDPADCPTGPLAHCTVGDFLLANDVARFVVQKAGQRELHFTATYGGNLIDAELVVDGVRQGRDNFHEIQPAVNIESVVNAVTVEVVNDGEDGTAAIVRSCGPDDLLDDINPSSVIEEAGATFPPGVDDQDYEVWGCTEYRLEAGSRTLELRTTIENMEASDLGLFVGDFVSGGGELDQWTPLSPMAPLPIGQAGLGEMLANWGVQLVSFFGFDDAEGVDYALLAAQPPEVPLPSSTFTQAGVTYVLHGHAIPGVLGVGLPPNFVVPAGGAKTFRRWFAIGDGSAANALEAFADAHGLPTGRLRGCVRDASGDPLPGARVAAGRDLAGGTSALQVVRAHWVTDAEGCYDGRIPPGSYLVAAAKEGFPYEGGGSAPATHLVTVTEGGTAVQDVVLPETGRLRVTVVDHLDRPVPARVSVVGFDPSPEPSLFATVLTANDTRTNLFYDRTADGIPGGLAAVEYTEADGTLEIFLEPGEYQVAVSRGTEWSLHTELVTVSAGAAAEVAARIAPVLDTTGWISADFHVHMIDSPDSRVSRRARIRSYAGEGVDTIIATDHAAVTDLDPEIASTGFTGFVNATPGEEITTFDYGHFNAYPQGIDPAQPQTRGATDHAGAAPPGEDFPSRGHFNLTPAEIHAAVLAKPANAGLETVVQVNHIDSHFDPLKIDSAVVPPRSFLEPGEPAIFRLDPSVENFFHHFPALELWNGASAGKIDEFLNLRAGIWMNLLNQGLLSTFVADTDTHEYHSLSAAGARSWVPSSTDDVAAISDLEIARAVHAGKLVGGQGLFVTARLQASDGSGAVAELAGVPPAGAAPASVAAGTLLSVANGEVDLVIRVQAPTWAPYDRIELYRNATTTVTRRNDGVPTLYGAVPSQTLHAGTDFTIETVPVNGAERLETNLVLRLDGLVRDEWIVVAARGVRGVSPPMFPVYPHSIDIGTENPTLAQLVDVTAAEQGVRALGVTNALFVDVDGNGVFDAPGLSVAP